jgi:hypothetical protein
MTVLIALIQMTNPTSGMYSPATPFQAKGPVLKNRTVPAGMINRQMVLRWTAAGMRNSERSFRRIKGHK